MVMGLQVLVLPAHTSHLMQMFDIVMGSVVKRIFKKKCQSIAPYVPNSVTSRVGALRYIAISALIGAWAQASDIGNCRASGFASGIYPLDKSQILNSHFVPSPELIHFLSSKDTRRHRSVRLDISGQLITDSALIQRIRDGQVQSPKLKQLDHFDGTVHYAQEIERLIHLDVDTRLLSNIPPLIYGNSTPRDRHSYGKVLNFD
jgi:hypothetical protein